ncbi:hypothetical protein [Bacillus sp. B1-b2]|uniref:hypothetical protein n=1 Tax=Bacillus sp. B1-b2 TaxID=2653201 RepID=UPI0012615A70|nr:hypothetical protein [Bacillus sp. B1-b2]KAB7672046.1 hypothetical protein F9279_03730 [Bacillus sp. B1-b2]
MSLDHTKTMLKTLKQYHTSEINVLLNGKDGTPILTICYKDGCYELKNLITSVTETCDDIDDTIYSINRFMNVG